MSEQDGSQATALQRPPTNDPEAWKAYWKAQEQPWRTEPEIDADRQKYLDERRNIAPDIEQDIYPFKKIKLNRADVEWLLATLENEQESVDQKGESYCEGGGVDIRGADLQGVNLRRLPLAGLSAGFNLDRWSPRYVASAQLVVTHLEGVDLSEVHLEGANLRWVHLEEATLRGAHLEGADLQYSHLEGADLREAHLERANLRETFMTRANLRKAHLEGADLRYAHLWGANLRYLHLEGKHLPSQDTERIQKWAKHVSTTLPPGDLREVFFDQATNLGNAVLGNTTHGFVQLADVHWGSTNLSYVNWSSVKMLGDEHRAHQTNDIDDYRAAVRANRQLAVVLREQGLNEEADHFAYRAQLLQRTVWRLQERLLKYALSWLLYLLAGYGYRPLRSLIAYLVIIFGFMGLYLLNAHFVAPHLGWDEALVLSVSSFHGRGFFTQNVTLGDTYARLAAGEAIVGLFIEISFIATFTQRFFAK